MNIYKDMLLPIACIIVGSLLTYYIQYNLKQQEVENEKINTLENLKNNLNKNVSLLYFYLKSLAYLRVDTKYQEYQYENVKDKSTKKKAHEESYNNYKYISEVQNKIAIAYSSLYSDYINIASLVKGNENYVTIFLALRIDLMNLEHSPLIDSSNESQIQEIISNLTNNYVNKLKDIESLCFTL